MQMHYAIKDDQGATVVELALISMLLFIFVFGILEFGLALYNKHVLTNASREGARAGVVVGLDRAANEPITVSQTAASNYCASHLITFGASPNLQIISSLTDTNGTGVFDFQDDLRVNASYQYDFLFFSVIGFGPITLTANTIMKLE